MTIARRSPPARATARTALAIAFATAALWRSALAGPPFLTDDPEPVDYHHSEFYVFATDDQTADGRSVALPAFEYN